MPLRTSDVFTVTLWPETAVYLMARVLGAAGTPITQGTVSSISVKTYLAGEEVYSATPSVSSVIYDALQTDDRWEEDNVGYNFGLSLPGSAFPDPTRRYQVEIIITPSSGSRIVLVGQVQTRTMIG